MPPTAPLKAPTHLLPTNLALISLCSCTPEKLYSSTPLTALTRLVSKSKYLDLALQLLLAALEIL